MVRTVAYIGVVVLCCVVSPACVPVPGDQGGSIPPPAVDTGGVAPPFNPNQNVNGGDTAGGDTLVFAVSVDARSLSVDAIVIDAVLTVVQSIDVSGARTITGATLQDIQNAGSLGDTAIVGGLLLTASRASLNGFDLTVDPDGVVVSVFRGGGASASSDRFVLPGGGQVFVPGAVGITHEVAGGSRFSFRINGDRVTGELGLNGFPIATFGESDVYEGTFAGTRSR